MNETPVERHRIYSHMTRTRFLHVEDSLEIGKLRLFAGTYTKGEGMGLSGYHFMDVDDVRVIFSDLAWGKPVTYEEFKGSVNGHVISRILTIKTKEDKVWFELKSGPGKKTDSGAVLPAWPAGKPETEISVAFTIYESRRLAFAVLAYLAAWESERIGMPYPKEI